MTAPVRVIEIGDLYVGGIYQFSGGIFYDLGSGLALRVEYRYYYVSDPFRGDRGLNTYNALLGISFYAGFQAYFEYWAAFSFSLMRRGSKPLFLRKLV